MHPRRRLVALWRYLYRRFLPLCLGLGLACLGVFLPTVLDHLGVGGDRSLARIVGLGLSLVATAATAAYLEATESHRI